MIAPGINSSPPMMPNSIICSEKIDVAGSSGVIAGTLACNVGSQ
jgi:hypothetical protein